MADMKGESSAALCAAVFSILEKSQEMSSTVHPSIKVIHICTFLRPRWMEYYLEPFIKKKNRRMGIACFDKLVRFIPPVLHYMDYRFHKTNHSAPKMLMITRVSLINCIVKDGELENKIITSITILYDMKRFFLSDKCSVMDKSAYAHE